MLGLLALFLAAATVCGLLGAWQLDRARQVRDHGCRYPGCTRPHGWTQAHHVIHWKDGGLTILTNIVSLCDHHHVVHQPGWTATFDGHTFAVYRPDGTQIT